jgi:CSLREA domain-containing protein
MLGSALLVTGLTAMSAVPAGANTSPGALNSAIVRNPAHAAKVRAPLAAPSKPKRPFLSSVAPQAVVGVSHVFTVNKGTDSVDANPGNGTCADATGKCSLRAAVQEADALNRPVTINLPPGTYTLSIAPNNATTGPDDITSGDLNVTDAGGLVINGAGATINATGLGDRIFEVRGGASLQINGATLTGGHAADNSSYSGTAGGGLALPDTTSAATLQGVTLTGNSASDNGGAIFNNGALWLTGSAVTSNAAAGPSGGALYNLFGAAQVVGDRITGNTANAGAGTSTARGGGIYDAAGPVSVQGSTIIGNRVLVGTNRTGEGGGVYAGDDTIIGSSTIAGNSVGAAPSATNVSSWGGGVYTGYGLESITNTVIDHNTAIPSGTAQGEGGGIYDAAGLVLANSKVTNNSVRPGTPVTDLATYGGGISIGNGTEQITNTLIDRNSAISAGTGGESGSGEGGGIFNGGDLNIATSTVSNNTAGVQNQTGSGGGAGGGISEEGNNALIVNTQIVGNQALGGTTGTFAGSGGGILANDIMSISGSVIANNHAAQQGGGLWSDDGQHVIADTISGNTAQAGGGIWNKWQTEVDNSTISGNSTSGPNNAGGGVFDSSAFTFQGAKVVLSSSTVANNRASAGSGLAGSVGVASSSSGGFVLSDTIVGANIGASQCRLASANLTSTGHNLSSDTSCALVARGDVTGVSPALKPLALNGGPTATQALAPTSPAIDAGDCPAVDQRGFPRPPVRCDIGAYEQSGYRFVASDGGVFDFGDAGFWGSTGNIALNQPVVGIANTVTGHGYWLVASDGGIFSFGDAHFHGSTGNIALNKPIVGMAATPTGNGYWLVASDGGIFSFGDAHFHGSTGNIALNKPIVGMAATPTGNGYWLVASDGGIFSFGDAHFHGSTGNIALNKPIVGMAATPTGNGYWLVASDGGIFSFGDAHFHGSTGAIKLNRPIVAMATTPDGNGYWLVASDGGVFSFGDAHFHGSTGNIALNKPIVGGAGV